MALFKIVLGLLMFCVGFVLGVEEIGFWSTFLKIGGGLLFGLELRKYMNKE
ncbi:MAG: hypothetical protein MJK08_10420 [Campylobacterales bacterium]|nr:hypothetical protein [Campylobacterales bacterium]